LTVIMVGVVDGPVDQRGGDHRVAEDLTCDNQAWPLTSAEA
jgi:hypothetical protein